MLRAQHRGQNMIEKLRVLAEKEGIKLVLMVCHIINKKISIINSWNSLSNMDTIKFK